MKTLVIFLNPSRKIPREYRGLQEIAERRFICIPSQILSR
jgi:hypothetical protein